VEQWFFVGFHECKEALLDQLLVQGHRPSLSGPVVPASGEILMAWMPSC
jgi:hypothetical protein